MDNKERNKNVKKQIGKERILCGVLLLSMLFCAGLIPDRKEQRLQQEIAAQVLRFHVRANSDQWADQDKKQKVKEGILTWMEPIIEGCGSKEEVIEKLRERQEDLKKEADRLAAPDKTVVSLKEDWFPEKNYGSCTFPEGWYQALRIDIDIGKGKGHNWWCVLYPTLCFQDALHPVMAEEGEEELQMLLEPEAFDLLHRPRKLKIRFGLEFFGLNR